MSTLIRVYFESGWHPHTVAVMDRDLYDELFPKLEKLARSKGYRLTESELENTDMLHIDNLINERMWAAERDRQALRTPEPQSNESTCNA